MWTLRRRPAAFAAPARPLAEPAAVPVDGPAGCGWFESSHDLQSGLDVQEHADPAAVAASLPLDDWIGLYVATGGRGVDAGETQVGDDRALELVGAERCVVPGGGGWRSASASVWACSPPAAAART